MHAPRDTARPPRASFASFIYGPESLIAYRAAWMAAQHPGTASPLTIHGAAGLGKTHLLRAIAGQLAEDGSGRAVRYVHAEALGRDVTVGVRRRRGDVVLGRYARADALLIDDLTALAGSTAFLEDVAAIIDAVQGRGGQVVASWRPRSGGAVPTRRAAAWWTPILRCPRCAPSPAARGTSRRDAASTTSCAPPPARSASPGTAC